MSGKKKKIDPLDECVSIRLTKNQKELLVNNKWIANDLRQIVRDYLNVYINKH